MNITEKIDTYLNEAKRKESIVKEIKLKDKGGKNATIVLKKLTDSFGIKHEVWHRNDEMVAVTFRNNGEIEVTKNHGYSGKVAQRKVYTEA